MSMLLLSISSPFLGFNEQTDKKSSTHIACVWPNRYKGYYLFDKYISFQLTKESLSCFSSLVLAEVLMSLENQLAFGPGWPETMEKTMLSTWMRVAGKSGKVLQSTAHPMCAVPRQSAVQEHFSPLRG